MSMLSIGVLGSLLRLVSLFIGLSSLSVHLWYNNRIIYKNGVLISWAAYVIFVLLSTIWSNTPNTSFIVSFGLIQVLIISFTLTVYRFSENDMKFIEIAWILVAIICVFLLLSSSGNTYFIEGRRTIVLRYGFVDPNELTAYFIVPTVILVSKIIKKQNIYTIFLIILFMLVFYSIIITGSRSGILSFILTVIFTLFKSRVKIRNILFFVFIGVISYYLVFNVFRDLLPVSVLQRLQFTSINNDGGSDRFIIWQQSITNTLNDGFRFIYGYGPFGAPNISITPTMHNHFLQSFVDGGLMGLLLFSIFIFLLLIKKSNLYFYLPSIIGAIVMIMTLTSYASFKPIWTIFMMGLVNVNLKTSNKIEQT